MQIGRLHVLTDDTLQHRFSHHELAQRAAAGGADVIQFRQKTGSMRAKLMNAEQTAHVCAEAGVPLIIDDHLELMLATDALGVHLGQQDLPIHLARTILGPRHVIGATVNTLAQAMEAWNQGADYLGFGPVYPTTHKEKPAEVRGIEGLSAICAAVSIPVIAIAGITPERVPEVMGAGAHGVAVLGGICLADDPTAATRRFREVLDRQL